MTAVIGMIRAMTAWLAYFYINRSAKYYMEHPTNKTQYVAAKSLYHESWYDYVTDRWTDYIIAGYLRDLDVVRNTSEKESQ